MPPKSLLDFFTRSLNAFQASSSPTPFRVLCTLPHQTPEPQTRQPAISSTPSTLTVLDSSFNPPTTAHLSMLLSSCHSTSSSPSSAPRRILLLLSVNNADKAAQPASFAHRLCMMEMFARDVQSRLSVASTSTSASASATETIEVDIGVTTKPYFHDKAAAIRECGFYGDGRSSHEESSGFEQVFLVGFDTLVRILDVKYYPGGMADALDPFFRLARLRVTARPDEKWGVLTTQQDYLDQLPGVLEREHGRGWWGGRVVMVQGESNGEGVSSSRAREVVREGGEVEELEKLVGQEVRGFIEREELYRT